MPTWTWHVEGNKLIIFQGEGYGNMTMEAYFNEDCMGVDMGTFRSDYVDHGNWRAYRM